jgi:hypothetical protein
MRRANVAHAGVTSSHVPVTHPPALLRTQRLNHERQMGNQAMLRRLSSTTPHLQAKLKIGAVNDPLEAEADRMADHVMRTPAPDQSLSTATQQVSRKCAECEEEDKKVNAKADGALAQGEAPPVVHDVLNSPGQPLDRAAREFFEPRFGHDFGDVKIHTGTSAAESAHAVNAHAYTVGNHIAFAPGRFAPDTHHGRRLLAHELTHVVQQGGTQAPEGKPTSSTATHGFGTAQHSIQRDANSPEYQTGYQDGLSGGEPHPGPLNDDAMTDYNEGYAKGHYEFTHKDSSASAAPSAGSAAPQNGPTRAGAAPAAAQATAAAAPAPAPDSSTIDSIVAAVNKPQENGVGDYVEACGILDGMWIVVMMQALEQLKTRNVFDSLQANCPANFTRVKIAIAAVAAKASPPVKASFGTDNPDFASLPEQQQHEVATYLGLPWPIPQQAAGASSLPTTGQIVGYTLAGLAIVGTVVFFVAFPEAIPILALIVQVGATDVAATATADVGATVMVEMVTGASVTGVPTATVFGEAALVTTESATVATTTAATTTATTTAASSTAVVTGTAIASTTLSSDNPEKKEDKQSCQGPTGLSPAPEDAIPITWFKPIVKDFYPKTMEIGGHSYHRDDPSQHLPHGEQIGINPEYRPFLGKPVQLDPTDRGSAADDFRAVTTRYGFDWNSAGLLQADHVQDLQWGGPDQSDNIWPLDRSANLSAGPRQNDLQVVNFCETPRGPRRTMTIGQMKAASSPATPYYGRWFVITNVTR